jgi:hypothetical protein
LSEIFSIKLKISDPLKEMVQSNFGMVHRDGGAKTDSGSKDCLNGRMQDMMMPRLPDISQPAILLPNYAPGGKFSRGSGSIEYTTDMGMPANPYRDRLARLPDLSHPALRQQFQGNNSADAQPIQGNNPPVFDVIKFDGSGTIPNRVDRGGRNPSQTYQNQENRSFSNSYGNSYGNSMSGYQPQYGSRGGFGMQQPMYGGGMGIMGLQSPFGGYGMQSPFGSYGGGMQQPMYGGMQQGYGMQSPYGGYGMQQPQYQSSPFSPQFGGGIGSMFPGMGGGYGGGYGQPPQYGGGYGQQPSYGGNLDTVVAMVADTAVEWVAVTSAAIMAAIWAVDTDNNPLVTAVSMVGIILNKITINDPKPSQDLRC